MGWDPQTVQLRVRIPKGHGNTVANVLSQVTTWLDSETMKSILNGVTLGTAHWAEIHDPAMVEGDQCLEQEVWVTAGHPLVEMHVTDWANAQREDPVLSAVLDWLKAQKQTNLKTLLAEHASSEEGKLVLWNQQNFHDSPESLVPMLSAQRQNWRPPALHSSQGAPCHHTEWAQLRPRPSRVWLHTVLVVRMFVVARNDQPDAEFPKVLHVLLAARRQFVQSTPRPNCVHHSNGSHAHRLY